MERLLGAAISSSQASDIVRSLTDAAGPRSAGSPGDAAAVAWALGALKARGFANVRAEKVLVPHWVRGAETGEIVAPVRQRLLLTALGGSVPTPPGGVEAEVVEVTSLEAADGLGERARGKIVFFYKRMERRKDGSGYGETVPIRGKGASKAARAGAVGMLMRSVGTSDARFPHTGGMAYEASAPRIPAAALAAPDADQLHRILAEGKPVRVRFSLATQDLPQAESANVMGEIRGRTAPDEIVLLGAHLDSWDLGTGAVDDGAGCAIVIEAARLIATLERRPRRTIRVVLYANEEFGQSGAKAYAKEHAAELSRHAAAVEADIGAGAAMGFSWNAGPGAERLVADVASLLKPLGAGSLQKGGDGGADIGALKIAGVPLFGIRQDASRYFDLHHSADDTFDKIDPRELDTAVATTAVLAYALADSAEPLARIPAADRATPER